MSQFTRKYDDVRDPQGNLVAPKFAVGYSSTTPLGRPGWQIEHFATIEQAEAKFAERRAHFLARYRSYGWRTQTADLPPSGNVLKQCHVCKLNKSGPSKKLIEKVQLTAIDPRFTHATDARGNPRQMKESS